MTFSSLPGTSAVHFDPGSSRETGAEAVKKGPRYEVKFMMIVSRQSLPTRDTQFVTSGTREAAFSSWRREPRPTRGTAIPAAHFAER